MAKGMALGIRVLLEAATIMESMRLLKDGNAEAANCEPRNPDAKDVVAVDTNGAIERAANIITKKSYNAARRGDAFVRGTNEARKLLVTHNKGLQRIGKAHSDEVATIEVWNDLPRRRKAQVVEALENAAQAALVSTFQ
jgi:hypothetical protein